jgi:Flp pilus assembly protein TadG
VRVSKAAISAHDIATRFWRDRTGAVAVAVAVLLPVLIGFAGIGIEVGLWFAVQRQNQSAADAAAISAALEYAAQIESGVTTDPAAAAATTANYNLFSTSSPNTLTLYPCYGFTITVGSSCNTSSSSGAVPNAVQVVLTQPLNTTFASFVTSIWGPSVNTVNVTTTAIAAFPQTSSACILALDPTAPNAVFVDNGTVSNPNCWVASNSSSGSALNCNGCTITGPTTVVGGDAVSNNGHLNGSPNRTYASAVADPYASVSGGSAGVCTTAITLTNTSGIIKPDHYCGIELDHATLSMDPGVYHIDNVFSIQNGSTLIANSVTIVINTGGAMQVGTNSTLKITAPSTGSIPVLEVYLAL